LTYRLDDIVLVETVPAMDLDLALYSLLIFASLLSLLRLNSNDAYLPTLGVYEGLGRYLSIDFGLRDSLVV